MRIGYFVFLLWFMGGWSISAQQILQPTTFNRNVGGYEFSMHSQYITEKPMIQVSLPEDYHQMAAHVKYPVIYTFDGWILSKSVNGIIHHLSHTGAIPRAIVVSVYLENEAQYGPVLYQSKSGWGDDPTIRLKGFSAGGVDNFMKFLKHELIANIDAQYRTNDFRAIIGMSPTSTFSLHSFWAEPHLFNAHILFAATDVLGMGYTPETTFVDKIEESLAAYPNKKRFLYIGSAAQEAPILLDNIAHLKKRRGAL